MPIISLPAICMIGAAFMYFAHVGDFFHILMTGANIQFTYLTFLYITGWNPVIGYAVGVLAINLIFSEERKKTVLTLLIFG